MKVVTESGLVFILQDFQLERWVRFNVEGAEPPLLLFPDLPRGWRWVWPGEGIPAGSEWWDWRDETFQPVTHAVGATMNVDPLHVWLLQIPVRVRADLLP